MPLEHGSVLPHKIIFEQIKQPRQDCFVVTENLFDDDLRELCEAGRRLQVVVDDVRHEAVDVLLERLVLQQDDEDISHELPDLLLLDQINQHRGDLCRQLSIYQYVIGHSLLKCAP